MNYLFFNESNRVRSGWRAAFFLVAFTVIGAVSNDLIRLLTSWVEIDETNKVALTYFSSGIFLAAAALIIGWWCGWLFENLRDFKTIGAGFGSHWLRHLLIGGLFGVASFCFAVIVVLVSGGEHFEFNANASTENIISSSVISFAVFAAMSAFEEALFRGYILQTLDRSELAWLAIMLTSLFFGAVHFGNPSATLLSTLNTILAGVWFSMAYLKTRDLWFVWGMHLMWNWTQGSIFGIEVSGLTDITPHPLLREIDNGPTWLTGTTYGIEGGIACTFALLLSLVLIYYFPLPKNPATLTADNADDADQKN